MPLSPRTRSALIGLSTALLLVACGVAWAEWRGWPWLARPLAGWLSGQLGRELRFDTPGPGELGQVADVGHAGEVGDAGDSGSSSRTDSSVNSASTTAGPAFRLSLLGAVRLQAAQLFLGQRPGLGAPAGAAMLVAREAEVAWRYGDLWALARAGSAGAGAHPAAPAGEGADTAPPLVLDTLAARHIAIHLLRAADGRASWQFGAGPGPTVADGPHARTAALDGVRIRSLRLPEGTLRLQDAPQALDVRLRFAVAPTAPAAGQPLAPANASALAQAGLRADGQGQWHGQPLRLSLDTGALGAWVGSAGPAAAATSRPADTPARPAHAGEPARASAPGAVAVQLRLQAGRVQGQFSGQVAQPLNGLRLWGQYQVSGPSLAAVGEPLGLALPTTAAFSVRGQVQHADAVWNTLLQELRVGRSQITGALQYQADRQPRPLLAGQLRASVLWLADLGPALGVPDPGPGHRAATATPRPPGRLLPDRALDLPVLRTMDAELAVAAERLETGTEAVQDALALAGHLSLDDGLLRLRRLDARLAGGRLRGDAELDARVRPARWHARLQLRQVNLAQWLRQPRPAGAPPYLAGRLAANLDLRGTGNSTAQWLASADGTALLHLRQGQLSHLALELAGLDLAEALGVALVGDQTLPVACAVADLVLQRGVVRPRVAVLDTADSTVWLEGQVSLADEQLQLLARVAPKDRSLLALRSPVRIGGSFARPDMSVQPVPLLRRLGLAGALGALVNPALALLPLLELGNDESEQARAACARARRPADSASL